MVRRARVVVPGIAHHITQRGNNRQDVFFTNGDRKYYLQLLEKQSGIYGLKIEGYCLMTNHVHVVGIPENEKSLSKAIGRTHYLYTQYVNYLHGRSGHLWQNRFYSCILDESHYRESLRYLEMNPVHASMVKQPWKYSWSSCSAHIGEIPSSLLDLESWKQETDPESWKEYLLEKVSIDQIERMELNIRTGRPLGSDAFISKLETRLNRRLRPLPVGRPKKPASGKTALSDKNE